MKIDNKNLFYLLVSGFLISVSNVMSADEVDCELKKVCTTLDRTIFPENVSAIQTVSIENPADFKKYGYGLWHYETGLPYQKRLDLMPLSYVYYHDKVTHEAKPLLRFFTISDVHITDEESPAQAIVFRNQLGNNDISVYSPLMLYTTHVLDAAVKKINNLHKKDTIDFGLALGDLANNTQYNELKWFIHILDGKWINPDSGAKNHVIFGLHNDYQDGYEAEGLDPSIPWYAVIGNHDHFWIGSKPVNDLIRKTLIGSHILQVGNILTDPNWMNEKVFSGGTLDGSKPYAPIIGEGVVKDMETIPKIIADTQRRSLSKDDWMREFSNTHSNPKGHGFGFGVVQKPSKNKLSGEACYSFEPKSNLPIKVIVLDDTQDETNPNTATNIYGHGYLGKKRHDWLIEQLQAGQNEGKLMIIAAHIPIGVVPIGDDVGWLATTPVFKEEQTNLIQELKTYPNLILWVSGHRHLNTVTAFKANSGAPVENSFWEVETKSLREFPQQFRTFDIVRNSDNTISIFTTNVDPDVKDPDVKDSDVKDSEVFAGISRSYAIASKQIYGLSEAPNPTGSVSYNAELVKQLSPKMQRIIANLPTRK